MARPGGLALFTGVVLRGKWHPCVTQAAAILALEKVVWRVDSARDLQAKLENTLLFGRYLRQACIGRAICAHLTGHVRGGRASKWSGAEELRLNWPPPLLTNSSLPLVPSPLPARPARVHGEDET